MKRLLFILLVITFSCKSSTSTKRTPPAITAETAKTIMTYLADDNQQGRDTGSDGIDRSASYIEERFRSAGVKPFFEDFRDNFKAKELDAFNVVGVLEGQDPKLKNEYIVIGAHYDHVGYRAKPVENDSIANGANDNAAGTTGVMMIADYFGATKSNKRSLIFALFSAEEMGLLGSKHLAEKLKNSGIDLYTMINFEMIGVPFTDRDYEALVTGYDLSNMAQKINEYTGTNLIGRSDVAIKYNLFKRSDNYPFYEQFKLPCQTISSCDLTNFDYYHHVDDEIDKMDFEFMASFINKMIPGIEEMSNTPTKEIKLNE